jgi:hypothetical protein
MMLYPVLKIVHHVAHGIEADLGGGGAQSWRRFMIRRSGHDGRFSETGHSIMDRIAAVAQAAAFS